MTEAAQAMLQQMTQGYQGAVGDGNDCNGDKSGSILRIVLHGGDGLELCSSTGSTLGDAEFHAIDASNMGDHVGEFVMMQGLSFV